jgi:hypothetical protein
LGHDVLAFSNLSIRSGGVVAILSADADANGDQDLTPLEATFFFQVGRLWVRPDLLAQTYWFERHGHRIAVDTPSGVDGFLDEQLEMRAAVRVGHHRNPDIPVYGVDMLRVRVHFEADLRGRERTEDPYGQPTRDEQEEVGGGASRYNALLDRAFSDAHAVTSELLGWVRTLNRQWWLGLSSEPLLLLEGGTRLVIRGSKQRLYASLSRPKPPHLEPYPEGNVVGVTAIQNIMARMQEGSDQPPPDILLADALVLVERRRRGEQANLQQAVLLAAIACEVKVKQSLERKTPRDRRPLLSGVLESTRGTPQLFGRIAKAAVGRSLVDEDSRLYDRINALFLLRNRIAHRASVPPDAEAYDAIDAAHLVFQWLEGLPAIIEPDVDIEPPDWWKELEEPEEESPEEFGEENY